MDIKINTKYIKLCQFLKYTDICSTGNESKYYINKNNIKVNGEIEKRRGRKLYTGDIISINNIDYKIT